MRIALSGYGNMGQAIHSLAQQMGHEIVLIVDKDKANDLTPENLKLVDVMIDFSLPTVAFENIKKALFCGVPVVSGTTGWHEHLPEIENLCIEKDVAFMWGSNFSVGVNVFFKINNFLATLMNRFPEYNASLLEVHHNRKVDAPSGTAITIANDIIERLGKYECWVNQGDVPNIALPIESKREGDVVGYHQVKYVSLIDEICISHNAFSRDGFAQGAILAASWILDKKGFFDVKDMFNF